MANSKMAIKRWHQSLKRRERNRLARTLARTRVRRVREAAVAGEPEVTATTLAAAYSALDRAARKGVIHKKNADRRKRRLAALVAKQQA